MAANGVTHHAEMREESLCAPRVQSPVRAEAMLGCV